MRATQVLALLFLGACARGQAPAVPTPITLEAPSMAETRAVMMPPPAVLNLTLFVQNLSSAPLDVRAQDGAFRGTVLPDSTVVFRDIRAGEWTAFEAHDKTSRMMARRPAERFQMGDTVRWQIRDRDIWHVIPGS